MADAVYTVTKSEARNGLNVVVGKITNDSGTAIDYDLVLGFKPKYVLIVNITNLTKDEFFEGMTADHSLHTAIDGTISEASSNGFTQNFDGVTIAKEIAISAKVLYFKAIG